MKRIQFVSIAGVLAAGCTVAVPDLDKGSFACRSDEDCASDYGCNKLAGRELGRCVPEDQLMCGAERCDGACVLSKTTSGAVVPECYPSCNEVGSVCALNSSSKGVCGWIHAARSMSAGVLACGRCAGSGPNAGCAAPSTCRPKLGPAHYYSETFYCNVTGEDCASNADDDSDTAVNCEDSDCGNAGTCLCGNGQLDQGEACDGPNLNGNVCPDTLDRLPVCSTSCQFIDYSPCGATSTCNNGNVEAGEDCEPPGLPTGKGCSEKLGPGYTGILACSQSCTYDTSPCQKSSTAEVCGDHTDNDRDNLCDCFDPDCFTDAACSTWYTPGNALAVSGLDSQMKVGASHPSVMIDNDGKPWLAWIQEDGSGPFVQVRTMNPSNCLWENPPGTDGWVRAQGISQGAQDVTLRLGVDGKPTIAWSDFDANSIRQAFLAVYDGNGWGGFDGMSTHRGPGATGYTQEMSLQELTLDVGGGTTVLTWAQKNAGGTAEVTGMVFPSGVSGHQVWPGPVFERSLAEGAHPTAAISTSGGISAAWVGKETLSPAAVFLGQSADTGANWNDLPASGASRSGDGISQRALACDSPTLLAMPNDMIVAAFRSGGSIFGRVYYPSLDCWGSYASGSGASTCGTSDLLSSNVLTFDAQSPVLAIDDSRNAPKALLVWTDKPSAGANVQVYAARWDGNSWNPVVTGSNVTGGVSGLPAGSAPAREPSVAVGMVDRISPANSSIRRICIAWTQDDGSPVTAPPSQVAMRCVNVY